VNGAAPNFGAAFYLIILNDTDDERHDVEK